MIVIEFPERGTVTWDAGRLSFRGGVKQHADELEAAVRALLEMEDVDLYSGAQVREALLSMAGARLVEDSLNGAPGRHDGHP